MDDFLHDLIEEHYHIRRRYGLPFVHIKRWDRFERNPDKADPLTTTRRKYPTDIFKLYTSTKYDTSTRRVPWFYWAVGVLLIVVVVGIGYNYFHLKNRFSSTKAEPTTSNVSSGRQGNGARATVPQSATGQVTQSRGTTEDYIALFKPRIPAQPWSAPAYDGIPVSSTPPRIFCAIFNVGLQDEKCSCITEQGTRYRLDQLTCRLVVHDGQYDPFLQSAPAAGSSSFQSPASAHPSGVAVSIPSDGVWPAVGGIPKP
jgi:hypothetical protein